MSSVYGNQPVDTNKRLEKRFKAREDEYITYTQFHILVGTFNVNNRQAPNNQLLEEWLHRQSDQSDRKVNSFPDIVAVGFQEIDTGGGAYFIDDKKKEDEWEYVVRKTIQSSYHPKDEKNRFQLLDRVRLMGILLFVYVRTIHMPKCTQLSRTSVATGFMGIAGNKGGVGISFRCYETDICFVNCHFASGDGQTSRRNDDYQTIESRMTFSDAPNYSLKDYIWYTPTGTANSSSAPATTRWWKINDHDIVFWFGDMNYRISQPNEQVRKAITELSAVPLHEKDQLRCEMKLNHVFANYSEPPIEFMPTYKFDPKTDNYDTSEKLRTPSWTDRILYHAKRSKIHRHDHGELETIRPIDYSCAKTIRFSDHRPVSGLYAVMMKFERDEKCANRIRDELIRQMDREENDSIPTIEVHPRAPAIVFENLRYLDKLSYALTIKNVGECSCTFTLCPPSLFRPTNPIKGKQTSEEPFFDCLLLTPNPPYSLEPKEEQAIQIAFKMKSEYAWLFGKQLNEILILHVENGADTFITLDITLDMGPFGLGFNQFPPTLYDSKSKQYVYSVVQNADLVEMKNDPPALYIALVECLKARQDVNLLQVFNNEVHDSIDLLSIRDQIYQHNYDLDRFSSVQVFLILLHLLQALPEPLISRDIQDRIFLSASHSSARSANIPTGGSIQSHIPHDHHAASGPQDMTKAVGIIIEQLKPKERNLFFRFLLFIQKCWPTADQAKRFDQDQRNSLNIVIDILSMSLLHEHPDREQRHAFLLACLNEEKKKNTK